MADINRLEQENKKLQLAVNELSVLNDIATAISSTQPLDEVVNQIVLKCIKHLNAEEAAISLLERKDNSETSKREFHTMIRKQDLSETRVPIRLDSHITGWMLKNKESLLSNDIHSDDRFSAIEKKYDMFRSLLSVPLIIKGELIGYLAVFNKKDEQPFTEEDRRLLSIIGSQSAQVIENARLYEEEKALISLQQEMKLAEDIQRTLLPDDNPDIEGYQICASNIPAKTVGGDYYDFMELSENRLGFCVGDITGKGMPAAMLMANLQATLRSQTLVFEECCDCLQGTNRLLYRNTKADKFATLFYGILDTENHTIRYSNGGHNHPLLVSGSDEPVQLESTGMLLGVLEETDFEDEELRLDPGDLLVIYSDGITEAMNRENEEFGIDRLTRIIDRQREEPAHRIHAEIIDQVNSHSQNVSQSDDITLMVIKRS